MSYAKAKTDFEAVIKSMKADLDRWVASGKATQKAVNARVDMLNKLVRFFKMAEAASEEFEEQKSHYMMKYSELHEDTQKMVYLAKLHGFSPDLVFYYKKEELADMLDRGIRIQPPRSEFLKIKVIGTKKIGPFDVPEIEMVEKEIDEASTEKYQRLTYYLNNLCSKR